MTLTLTPSSGCFSNRSLIPSLMHSSALWRWWFSFTTITSFLCHLFHAFTHLLFANDLENCLLGVVMSQVISSCTGSVNTPPWSEQITKPRMIFLKVNICMGELSIFFPTKYIKHQVIFIVHGLNSVNTLHDYNEFASLWWCRVQTHSDWALGIQLNLYLS